MTRIRWPRGIGKTTIARIFAKALNCAKGPTAEPCDKCDSCREITESRGFDVHEFLFESKREASAPAPALH